MRRLAAWLGGVVLLYLTAAVGLGLLPVNRDFVPAPDGDGIELTVTANFFHTDIVLPMNAAGVDWTRWAPPPDDYPGATHIAFGWGDRDFYLETPTLADLKPLTALKAVSFSSDTALHITFVRDPAALPERRRIVVTPAAYQRLAAYIAAAFRIGPDGRPIPIAAPGYGPRHAFYEAVGTYSAFRTCNEWLGAGLRQAGIRTGWWTPFAFGITAHL